MPLKRLQLATHTRTSTSRPLVAASEATRTVALRARNEARASDRCWWLCMLEYSTHVPTTAWPRDASMVYSLFVELTWVTFVRPCADFWAMKCVTRHTDAVKTNTVESRTDCSKAMSANGFWSAGTTVRKSSSWAGNWHLCGMHTACVTPGGGTGGWMAGCAPLI